MSNKNSNKNQGIQINIKQDFTNDNLTAYAGALQISKYMENISIPSLFDKTFPTNYYSATKYSNMQILMSLCLASICDTNRISNIENFTTDPLIRKILCLPKGIDEDTLHYRLNQLGEKGARKLNELLFKKYSQLLPTSGLSTITIDIDSTVEATYGNQEGAAKGYNPYHKGANSYHPNIAFCAQTKQILGSWFRTGSAYTSNGTNELINQITSNLPSSIKEILFRMDCGYFSDKIISTIEDKGYNYLVKVKIRGFTKILKTLEWDTYDKNLSFCEFEYKCKKWDKPRKMIGVRRIKNEEEINFFNSNEIIKYVEYEYCALCTSLEDKAINIYRLYNKRGECENWIENLKHQFHGCHTITNNFWTNDIIWQLATLAYNISVSFRLNLGRNVWREEHRSFFRWFIAIPGKVIETGREVFLKMSKSYQFLDRYLSLQLA